MKCIRVAMLVFLDAAGSLLLNRRNDSSVELWGLLGGGIEPGEEPLSAIKREILEEVRYELSEDTDRLELIGTFQTTFDDLTADVHVFKAAFPGFELLSSSDEVAISDLKLVTLSQALNLPLLPLAQTILESNGILTLHD